MKIKWIECIVYNEEHDISTLVINLRSFFAFFLMEVNKE